MVWWSAVSHGTFSKMATAANSIASDQSDVSTSSSEESGDEDLITKAKRMGADLASPEKAKIARERKVQRNPAG